MSRILSALVALESKLDAALGVVAFGLHARDLRPVIGRKVMPVGGLDRDGFERVTAGLRHGRAGLHYAQSPGPKWERGAFGHSLRGRLGSSEAVIGEKFSASRRTRNGLGAGLQPVKETRQEMYVEHPDTGSSLLWHKTDGRHLHVDMLNSRNEMQGTLSNARAHQQVSDRMLGHAKKNRTAISYEPVPLGTSKARKLANGAPNSVEVLGKHYEKGGQRHGFAPHKISGQDALVPPAWTPGHSAHSGYLADQLGLGHLKPAQIRIERPLPAPRPVRESTAGRRRRQFAPPPTPYFEQI